MQDLIKQHPWLLLAGGWLGGFLTTNIGRLRGWFWNRATCQIEVQSFYYSFFIEKLKKECPKLQSRSYGNLHNRNIQYTDADVQESIPECWLFSKVKGVRVFISISDDIREGGEQDRRIKIWCFTKHAEKLRSWVKEELEAYHNAKKKDWVRASSIDNTWSGWYRPKRKMNTVWDPNNVFSDLLKDLNVWTSQEQKFVTLGWNFHFGILAYGPLGTGKTTLAHVIASELSREMVVITPTHQVHEFQSALSKGLLDDKVILFDEFDAFIGKKIDTELLDTDTSISRTKSILSLLDGPLTPHNAIFVFTTNYKEAIPLPMFRSGRIDREIHLENTPPEDFLKNLLDD